MGRVRQAFVGAGANLGAREATLRGAIERLRNWPGISRVEESSRYDTAPVGVVDQPTFLNLVVGLETTLCPEELLTTLLTIEQDFGRVRTERWGPRTLDLDLLLFEGEIRNTAALQLPHPRMFERSFVLVPLAEILEVPSFRNGAWDTLRERVRGAAVAASGVLRVD